MGGRRRGACALGIVAAIWAAPRPCRAQVRWDAAALVGATQRVAAAGPAPLPGPSAELHAHVAVLPMLRVGPYAAFDLSPVAGGVARRVFAGGLRAKLTPPLLASPWRAWAFVGVGIADAFAPRAGGSDETGLLEIPAGVGVGRKLRGPWALCVELGARVVAARTALAPGPRDVPPQVLADQDALAVSLSVGVSLGP